MKMKKLLALILAMCMVLSTMSFNVFAKEDNVTVYSLKQLQEALEGKDNCHIVINETIVISEDVNLDLNGKTITTVETEKGTYVDAFTILADVTITGEGTIDARPSHGYTFYIGNKEGEEGNLTIENGTFYGETTVVSNRLGTVTINGGYFEISLENEEDSYSYVLNCIDDNYKNGTASIEVKGGTFYKFNPADNAAEGANTSFVAEGYISTDNNDGTFGVVVDTPTEKIVATVNGTPYTDIQEAIKAAAPSGTVELTSDVTVDKWIMFAEKMSIGNGNLITLNINGLTIDGKGKTLTIKSIESASNGNRLFYDAQNLNINNLTINYIDDAANQGGIGLQSGTLENVNFVGGGYGVLPGDGDITVKDCDFATNSDAIYSEFERDNLVITGCEFNQPAGVNVILLRGNTTFTDNVVNSGRTVNVVSGSPVVTGNDFNDVRLKVYNVATATIGDNEINVLAFNDDSTVNSTFGANTLSEAAQAVLDAADFPEPAAKIGDTGYETVAKALEAAKAAGMTDVTITLVGETTPETQDAFDLIYGTAFDSVTFEQEDNSKPYYIDAIYTGDRTAENGKFIFDGVNLVITGQIWFECDVVLKNNATVTRTNDTKNFIYYGSVTIEPGSKFISQIDDIFAGSIVVDGGRNDGGYNETYDYRSIFLDVRSGQTMTIKNGAYVLVNSANEIGILKVMGTVDVQESKLEVFDTIDVSGTLNVDTESFVKAKKITGSGKVSIDASNFDGTDVQVIEADLSGFTGAVEATNNTGVECKIEDGKIILTKKAVAVVKIGEEPFASLDEALDYAKAEGMTEVEITVVDDIKISYNVNNFTKVTFTGSNREQTIDLNVGADFMVNTALAFNDLTVSRLDSNWIDNDTHISGGLVYNNCKMIGLFNVTAQDTDFIGCDFYNDNAFGDGNYSIWLYNCFDDVEVNIIDCKFDVYERAIKMYGDGYNGKMVLNITGTEFVSRTADKTVVEMAYSNNPTAGQMILNITDSTATGFGAPEHIAGETNAWFNVEGNSSGYSDSTVMLDSVQVWPIVKVASVTSADGKTVTEYTTLAGAVAEAKSGETVTLLKDVTVAADETITLDGINLTAPEGITLTNSGTIEIKGEVTLNIASLSGSSIDLLEGAIVKDSTVGGAVYVGGNVTFRGNNTFDMITDYGDYYSKETPSMWTVEKGGSLTLTKSDRYGLGYGDKVTVYGNLADGTAKDIDRSTLSDEDASINMYGGLVGMTNSASQDAQNSFTASDAYLVFGVKRDKSFGNKYGNYYGNYTFTFDNVVMDANGFKFYEDKGTSVVYYKDSNLLVNGNLMTNDTSSTFTYENTTVFSKATSNGSDDKNQNAGTMNLIASDITYSALVTNIGTINMDANSKFTAPALNNTGSIVIDATGVTEDVTLIDLSGDAVLANVTVNNLPANCEVVYGEDGDVSIVVNEIVEPELFDIAGKNMNLGNSLSIRFFVLASNCEEGQYAEIVKSYADRDDVTVTVPYSEWEDNRSYKTFEFNGVAAKEMSDEINVTIYNADGEAVSNVYTTSVRDYAMGLLTSNQAIEYKIATVDMLNYGAAAQGQLTYNTYDLANALLTDEQKALATKTVDYGEMFERKNINYVGTVLTTESNISLKLFFTGLKDDMNAVVTYVDHYGNEKTFNVTSDKFVVNGNYKYIEVEGLAVADCKAKVTCVVYNTDGEVFAQAEESIAHYLKRGKDSGQINEASDMLMKFSVSAFDALHIQD